MGLFGPKRQADESLMRMCTNSNRKTSTVIANNEDAIRSTLRTGELIQLIAHTYNRVSPSDETTDVAVVTDSRLLLFARGLFREDVDLAAVDDAKAYEWGQVGTRLRFGQGGDFDDRRLDFAIGDPTAAKQFGLLVLDIAQARRSRSR